MPPKTLGSARKNPSHALHRLPESCSLLTIGSACGYSR